MKKLYTAPRALLLQLQEDDVIRTSPIRTGGNFNIGEDTPDAKVNFGDLK